MKDLDRAPPGVAKFSDARHTADGKPRASVRLTHPETLWFNTGTLCNIACTRCYIESSPTNDSLAYLERADVEMFLDELKHRNWPVREIGFTGGEPFMNPDIIGMIRTALERGFEVLVLTNAMRPMMRPWVQRGLLSLLPDFRDRLTLRVSVDHHSAWFHDEERGQGSFDATLSGMKWLRNNGFRMAVAGRSLWGEDESAARQGFDKLFKENDFLIDAFDPGQTVIFPEMDAAADVPEITTDCWEILGKSPNSVMCASSRMVVRRKSADAPSVVACTLLPYEPEFDLGPSLADAEREVPLNHPHCAKFCVLGGASCSA